ncbi:MAG: Arc family DNA-binding protein [Oscillospiraceae bacterium]|nr:Arc family DNA-binding protein [Oscillospiraceae bacterium]
MKNDNSDIKSVSIRIPEKLLEEIRYVARYEDRSVNSQVLYLIRQCIEKFKDTHGDMDLD